MKVQDVKKDCTAVVGVSLEFSNSEISMISKLVWQVESCVNRATETAIAMAKNAKTPYDNPKDVSVAIDFKSAQRILWLLSQVTHNESSYLFSTADLNADWAIQKINTKAGLIDPDQPEVPAP